MKNVKNKSYVSTVILLVILLLGVALLLYPTVSDYYNSFHQTKAIAGYTEELTHIDEDRYAELWSAAEAYNASLVGRDNDYLLSDEQKAQYDELLNVSGTGIMGYIEIPALRSTLPLYHGTDEAVLQIALGHLEWTSLPVGGESTHCVISGHRGLPSAKLLTELDRLEPGDVFMLCILDEVLTYEVDQIKIVLPSETEALKIVEGKDYCTLVTCTPYGINTHRLLVRGHRIENAEEARTAVVTSDAIQIDPLIVAPIAAIPILLLLLIIILLPNHRQTKLRPKGGEYDEDI